MASGRRRAHQKSRLGCRNCKGRKIKCDEQKPACFNCLKRDVDCDFLGAESPQFALSSSSLNMSDLELLHNYTTVTYLTLSENPAIREFYKVSVVQVGFGCDYIMRALLAVSSLHLARYRPRLREHYQSVAIIHYQVASSMALPLIPDVSAETAQMLFLFSVLTTYYTLGWPCKEDDVLLLGDSGFPDWVFLLRGTRSFIDVAGVPKEGPLSPLFKHAIDRFILREVPADPDTPVHTPLLELNDMIAQRPLADDLKRIYATSIEELTKSFRQLQGGTSAYEMIDAFIWLFGVAEDLVPLLKIPTQESMAIFAYFCVLLKKLDGHWWIQGWAQHLVARVYSLLDEEWRLWIRWPMAEIGWVPPSVVA